MFISPAYAQGVMSQPDQLTTFILPMALVFVVFYFFMIRPQSQKQKEMKKMIEALRRGDRVVTAGGIIGTIAKADGDEVQLDIAENVRVRVVRSTITTVLTKPQPVSPDLPKDGGKKDKEKEPETAGADGGGSGIGKLMSFLRR